MLALCSFSISASGSTALSRRPSICLRPFSLKSFAGSHRCVLKPPKNSRTPSSWRRKSGVVRVDAMVNVDVSPSVLMGVGLIGAGVSLWQIRQAKPEISKDYDVVISCVSLLVGGILIFQGWRLDPLLLFGQIMTTGAAVSFGIEALRLRAEQYEGEEKAQLRSAIDRNRPPGDGGAALQLPPPPPDQQQPWASSTGRQAPWDELTPEQQQQWEASFTQSQAGYSDYYYPGGQQGEPPASSSGYYQPGQVDAGSSFGYPGAPTTSYPQQQQRYYSGDDAARSSSWSEAGSQPYVEPDYTVPPPEQGGYSSYYPPAEYSFPPDDQYPPSPGAGSPGSGQGFSADWQQQRQQQQDGRQARRPPPSSYDAEDWD